jgi:hypothetical protein
LAEYAGVDPYFNGILCKNTLLADGSLDKSTTNSYTEASRTISGNHSTLMAGV